MTQATARAPDAEPPPKMGATEAEHFRTIAQIAHRDAGLVLPQDKAPMVLARIAKRMRSLGMRDLAQYCKLLADPDAAAERHELIFVLTTNVTSFMREAHHFETLREQLLPDLVETARKGGKVRLWSAGCSSGQEPYSLAMILLDLMPDAARHDVRILATDIDPYVLRTAREGVYSDSQIDSLPGNRRAQHFHASPLGHSASPALRDLISFRELNLIGSWPMRGTFDVIFCRNVVIYFDRETQSRLWSRLHAALSPGGHLFLGHSERIDARHAELFTTVGTTTYRKSERTAKPQKGPAQWP